MKLKILNNKEIKELYKLLDNQYGFKSKLDYAFVKNPKNKIFAVTRDISKIALDKIRINSLGMYFCEISNNEVRLSIEGSQLIGRNAAKNIVELDREEVKRLLRGEDLNKDTDCSGFVILKHKHDYLGTGKVKNSKILNYINKSRRINPIY